MPRTVEIRDTARWRQHAKRRSDAAAALKYVRGLKGLNRDALAALLGEHTGEEWTANMVAKLENGQKALTVELLAVIAEVLDVPVAFLVYGPNAITLRYLYSAGHSADEVAVPAAA